VLSQIIPVGILLSVLISLGMMNKHNELTALRSCGISVYALTRPILTLGLVFTFALFFLSEVIVPVTMTTANRIWVHEVRQEKAVTTRENDIWLKTSDGIMHIRRYLPAEKVLYKVTLNTFDEQFRLIRRIDAEHARYVNGEWILADILEQNLDDTGGSYTMGFHEYMTAELDLNPESLQQVTKRSSEMNIKELLHYIHSVEESGYPATQYRVDFHAKIAFPFVCMILVLAGVGIASRNQLKDGLPAGIAYGIGIAFFYWVLNSFCISLGYGELLPPIVAAWAANAVFLCFGIIMLLHTEQI
jgi:lipopolysaccharide export system permease protein